MLSFRSNEREVVNKRVSYLYSNHTYNKDRNFEITKFLLRTIENEPFVRLNGDLDQ